MNKVKEIEIIDLPPFVCDDLHFDGKEIDGHNKIWNYVVCEREAGKSTRMWKKIYDVFRKFGFPSVIFKRQAVDITEQDIEDNMKLLQKFIGIRLPIKYTKGDIKQGMMDIYLNNKLFVRYIALSSPLSRLKSKFIKDVKYFMFDEFICNTRLGEKYIKDEPFRIKEIYTTYNRESSCGIKMYFFGNPYSLFNPYFSRHNVNTKLLYPGAIVSKDDYVIQCYQIKQELKDYILKNNPMYQFDSLYKQYAFDGRAIQDANINLLDVQPLNFKLQLLFKLNNKILGIYTGFNDYLNGDTITAWCKLMKDDEIGKNRQIRCFDFSQMASKTTLVTAHEKVVLQYLKQAIAYRQIAFKDIECSYMIEEIYANI